VVRNRKWLEVSILNRENVLPRNKSIVEFAPDKHSFDNFMELPFFLEELLGRKVELVTPEALSHHSGPHILREVERVPLAA
jgi:hypothetical protein